MAGDLCEGNFRAHGIWYPGKISVVHEADGFVDIEYDDGDAEARVPPTRVRRRLPTQQELLRQHSATLLRKNLWCHECQAVVGSGGEMAAERIERRHRSRARQDETPSSASGPAAQQLKPAQTLP